MAGKKKTGRVSAAQQRAQNATYLRFGPELDALGLLAAEAQAQYRSQRKQNQLAADGVVAAIRDALPQAQEFQLRQVQKFTGPQPVASEGAIALNNAGLTAGALSSMLAQQQVRAQDEAKYRNLAAQRQYEGDVAKVNSRREDLARQAGVFAADFLQQEEKADRQRADKFLLAGIDPKTGDYAPGREPEFRLDSDGDGTPDKQEKSKKAKKPKLATPLQHGAFADQVGATRTVVEDLKESGFKRGEIARMLLRGMPSDKKTGFPGVPKTGELTASVALDLVFDRHVSKRNVANLHKRRYSVKRLGYPTTATAGQQVGKGVQQAGQIVTGS